MFTDASVDQDVEVEPDQHLETLPALGFDGDQRDNWGLSETAIRMCCGALLRVKWAADRKRYLDSAPLCGSPECALLRDS
jgi:hypothetical protein